MTKRKEPGDYAAANMDRNGNYLVGKGRPPESGKFRAGDNRKRGRRAKGTRNLASDLREELDTMLTVIVSGKSRKISRQRAVVMRLADNASKGRDRAIELLFRLQQALVAPLLERELEQAKYQSQMDLTLLSDEDLDLFQKIILKGMGVSEEDYLNMESSEPAPQPARTIEIEEGD